MVLQSRQTATAPVIADAGDMEDSQPLPMIRGCDGCTLCCKVMAVRALDKPQGKWCPHCKTGFGCGIYEDRPDECRVFACGYLVMPHLAPIWRPAVSHLIISSEISQDRMSIHVDPARPDAWRKEPYYSTIRQWSVRALASAARS